MPATSVGQVANANGCTPSATAAFEIGMLRPIATPVASSRGRTEAVGAIEDS